MRQATVTTMADQTNPFTIAGMASMMQPNPYTQYGGKPLPIPGYMGAPTDAQGNPIQSFTDAQAAHDAWNKANPAPAQGTTLNSTPGGNPNPVGSPLNPMGDWSSLAPNAFPGNPSRQAAYARELGLPGSNYNGAAGAGAGQAPAASAAPQNPIDMRQAYLTALSNPGKPSMPGATVPQAQPLGTPSVLNSFLAAHPSGGATGAGGYSNQGFFQTLNKLRAAQ